MPACKSRNAEYPRGRRVVAAQALCGLLLAQYGAAAGEAPRLEELEREYQEFAGALWSYQNMREYFGGDIRGRGIADDLASFVLSAASAQQLQAARQRAAELAAKQDSALPAVLSEAKRLLDAETAKADTLLAYWAEVASINFHEPLWRSMAERSAPAERAASERRVAEARASLQLWLGETMPSGAARRGAERLRAEYNAERMRLSGLLNVAVEPVFQRDRLTPCPPAAPPIAPIPDSAAPVNRGSSVPLDEVYPKLERRHHVEGSVDVALRIDAVGCATHFAVTRSSGAPGLDIAALEWLESLQFTPAYAAGKAAPGRKGLRVSFRAREE